MRVFEASVSGGVVSANNGVVLDCPILGEGGDSFGYLVIAEETLIYLPKTTPDVKTFLTEIESLCTKLETLCTRIAAITVICATPGNASSIPVNSAAFITSQSDIATIHTALTNLKGALK
jgi:hypothetical protein